ncbi:hypothetical protein HHK36_019753 [Tetracentron sinense]|uniref:P-type Cu(+) transporter n=1 Tax=Tetracentron sinense TaxID=13715 RepID=A0A834YU75_TETSI|nr:hypothetical protein HHK36_019753 [Tetracentron sinense]
MERYLRENFDVQPKNSSEEALLRWRSAVSVVKNPRRRFRMVADLVKRSETEKKKLKIQEKIRVALFVQKAALQFIDAGNRIESKPSVEASQAGFGIDPNELASKVSGRDLNALKLHGGVEGLMRKVNVSLNEGVSSSELISIFQNTGSEVVKGKDGNNTILGTPTESALLKFGLLLGGDFDAQRQESKIVKVEPFNSVRKKMSVLVSLPSGGLRAFCKGASEIILRMCNKIVVSNGEHVLLSEEERNNITDVINSFACEALRTLCLAFKDIDDIVDKDSIPDDGYTLIAVVGIKDPVRPGVKDAVQICMAAGITVRMVTGDNINTAIAIAKECGILTDDGLAIEGPDFRCMSSWEMKELIPKLQVAKESADVIILDDKFNTIVNVARWGRAVYINIQKFVQFQLTVNVVALMLNFVSACISDASSVLNTVIFNSFVFCQVFNEINSRDIEKINVFRGMFDSWAFVGVMVSTVTFQVIIVEFLGTFASTVPLSWQLWLLSIVIGFVSMPLAVVIKCIPVEQTMKPTATAKHKDGYEALPSGPELA